MTYPRPFRMKQMSQRQSNKVTTEMENEDNRFSIRSDAPRYLTGLAEIRHHKVGYIFF